MFNVCKNTFWIFIVTYVIALGITYFFPNPHKQDIVYLLVFCGTTIFNLLVFLGFFTVYDIEREIQERKNERRDNRSF